MITRFVFVFTYALPVITARPAEIKYESKLDTYIFVSSHSYKNNAQCVSVCVHTCACVHNNVCVCSLVLLRIL